jgi:hypothetical protein
MFVFCPCPSTGGAGSRMWECVVRLLGVDTIGTAAAASAAGVVVASRRWRAGRLLLLLLLTVAPIVVHQTWQKIFPTTDHFMNGLLGGPILAWPFRRRHAVGHVHWKTRRWQRAVVVVAVVRGRRWATHVSHAVVPISGCESIGSKDIGDGR